MAAKLAASKHRSGKRQRRGMASGGGEIIGQPAIARL